MKSILGVLSCTIFVIDHELYADFLEQHAAANKRHFHKAGIDGTWYDVLAEREDLVGQPDFDTLEEVREGFRSARKLAISVEDNVTKKVKFIVQVEQARKIPPISNATPGPDKTEEELKSPQKSVRT